MVIIGMAMSVRMFDAAFQEAAWISALQNARENAWLEFEGTKEEFEALPEIKAIDAALAAQK